MKGSALPSAPYMFHRVPNRMKLLLPGVIVFAYAKKRGPNGMEVESNMCLLVCPRQQDPIQPTLTCEEDKKNKSSIDSPE